MAIKKFIQSANQFDCTVTEDTIQQKYIKSDGSYVDNASYYITQKIIVQPNTEYTWIFSLTGGAHQSPTVGFYDNNNNQILPFPSHSSGKYFSFTTPSNCAYIRASCYISSKSAAMLIVGTEIPQSYVSYGITAIDWFYRRYETATDVVTSLPVKVYGDGETDISLLLKGNTETSGTPSPSNPVTISGVGNETANLLPTANAGSAENNGITVECDGQGRYHIYGTATADSSIYFSLNSSFVIPVSVGSGGNGTFSMFNTVYNSSGKISLKFYEGINYVDNWSCTVANRTHTGYTSMGNKTIDRLRFDVSSGITLDGYINPEFTNNGELPSAFEPSDKYKISILKGLTALTPIYLSQQLLKVGDYSDDVNSSGIATYYIVKKVLDGTEDWSMIGGSATRQYIRMELGNFNEYVSDMVVCSHFVQASITSSTNDTGCNVQNPTTQNKSTLNIRYQDLSTLADYTTWLADQYAAGTPVTVYYVRATPTTETVTVPEITTTGGTATIDVDTTVKPSELDLTYHGWHEHQPLKRENGQWV